MKVLLTLYRRRERSRTSTRPRGSCARCRPGASSARPPRRRACLIVCDALEGAHTATTIRVDGGRRHVTDGPFIETKEQLGGFVVLEVRDLDEALRVGRAHAVEPRRLHHRDPAGHGLRGLRARAAAALRSAPRPERARRSERRRRPVPRALRAGGRGPDPRHRRLGRRRGRGPGRVRDRASSAGRATAFRATRSRGSSPSRATARSTGSGASARCAPAPRAGRRSRPPTTRSRGGTRAHAACPTSGCA